MARLLSIFLPILAISRSYSQTTVDEACNPVSQGVILRCIGSLADYAHTRAHPSLLGSQLSCRRYTEFRTCVSGVSDSCLDRTMGFVTRFYDNLCDNSIRSEISTHKKCVEMLEKDSRSVGCHSNVTMLSSEEGGGDYCGKYQEYLNCTMDIHWENCIDAVQTLSRYLSVSLPSCNLMHHVPIKDVGRPECNSEGVCGCPEGFGLDPVLNRCLDVNECEDEGVCSQHCNNTEGGYQCTCDEQHYDLSEDGMTCLRRDNASIWIYFAHGQSIWNISEDGKDFQLQRAALQKTAMIDLDMKENRLYYADIGADKMERMLLEGAFPETIQSYEMEGTEGIAVDWIGRNLYSLKGKDIYVQALDGRFRVRLYKDYVRLPRALAVFPQKGVMFFTDWSADAFIGKAGMDGAFFQKLITDGVVWPNGLAIDYYAEKLYWADAFLDTIECSNLDGTGRRAVVREAGSVPHVFGLAVMDDYLYWTDWTYRGILRADKKNGENVTVLAQTALLPYGIKLFYSASQPTGIDPCENKNCSHLCLLRMGREGLEGTCACSQGFTLADDGLNCQSNCTSSQILCEGTDPRCISRIYWCDGIAQCRDRTDERNCPPRICVPGQFQCQDSGKCFKKSKVCDGTNDCPDGSDEAYC